MAGILMTDPGFGRGQTLGVKDVNQGTSVTGTQKTFLDADPNTNSGKVLSNRPVTCIAVRNTSGSPLLPGTVAKFDAADVLNAVSGVSADGAGLVGVVDEYLPATGCPDKDVCWVVVSGPTSIVATGAFAAGGLPVAIGAGGKASGAPGAGALPIGYTISKKDAAGNIRTLVGVSSEHSA